MLNPITKNILVILLDQTTPISAQAIADQLGISKRIVYYRLSEIENWLSRRSAELKRAPGVGLIIKADRDKQEKLHQEVSSYTDTRTIVPPEKRVGMITLFLLLSPSQVIIKQIAYQFFLSRGTVVNDLKKAEIWLKNRGLKLHAKSNYGILISGPEINIREAIVELLFQLVPSLRLINICSISTDIQPKDFTDNDFNNRILNYLKGLGLNPIRRILDEEMTKYKKELSIEDKTRLILYIAISIQRIKASSIKGVEISELPIFEKVEDPLLDSLIAQINSKVMIFNYIEKYYLNIQMHSLFDMNNPDKEITPFSMNNLSQEIQRIIGNLLEDSALYLHPFLRVDNDLKKGLALHLTKTWLRIINGLHISNPLLPRIKDEYPYIYEVVSRYVRQIQKEMNIYIPEEEVGFLVMHLAAAMERLRTIIPRKKRVILLCNEGLASSWLLASRIRSEFPEIEIAGVFSILELQRERNFSDIEAIISTLWVTNNQLPVIVVSPLLTPLEINKIKQFLNLNDQSKTGISSKEKQSSYGPHLSALLHKDTIKIQNHINTWQECVKISALPLIQLNAIKPEYIQAIINAISELGPYMVIWPGIVLLHGRPEDGVVRISMSLTKLSTPVNFGHLLNDPVDLVFTLGAIDKQSHLRALLELAELCNRPELLSQLRSTDSIDNIIQIIHQIPTH